MNVNKSIAIVLLVLFVLSLPLSLAARDFASILFNQGAVTKLVVDNLVSDQALPALIHESLVLENWHGAIYKPFDLRMMVNVVGSIESREFVDLLNNVMPEKDRVDMVDTVAGGLFTWFDNDQPYPDITIPVKPVVDRVKSNAPAISAWIFRTFFVPACNATQLENYQAGDFGTDVQALVTCKPPAELKDRLVAATAFAIQASVEKQAPPAEIHLADILSTQIPAESMLAQKAQLNIIRRLLPFLWLLPVVFLLIAVALTVRSVKDLISWVQWPFFTVGAIGSLLVVLFGDPTSMITNALLPIPEALAPTPVVAVLLRIGGALFAQAGAAMLWQFVPFLIVGTFLLVFSYWEILKLVPSGLRSFLRSLVPPEAEATA